MIVVKNEKCFLAATIEPESLKVNDTDLVEQKISFKDPHEVEIVLNLNCMKVIADAYSKLVKSEEETKC